MPTIQIKENIHWVGSIDWDLQSFHGYSLAHDGSTYNAYLIIDDKITLFDTVPQKFQNELMHQIRSIINPEDIDYLVVHHVEMDHSGALPYIVDKIKPEKIFCSPNGKKAILGHFHKENWPLEVVKTGDSIHLGKRTINFFEAPMLHWPDSMFSYILEDKLLISNDAFGLNIASSKIFDDEHNLESLLKAASHYYANIILPYSTNVQKVLTFMKSNNIEIDMIAPDHGIIWRSHVTDILNAYDDFSKQKLKRKAIVVYDTMWKSTEKMAKAIVEGIEREGVEARLMSLKRFHHSDIMGEFADAAALICGSPTHNNSFLPLMADLLHYIRGLKPLGRIGAAFGSYGWSGEAVKKMTAILAESNFEIPIPEGTRFQFVPKCADLAKSIEFGKVIAQAIKEKIKI